MYCHQIVSRFNFRFEFEKNSVVKNPEEITNQLKKAETFLVNKWLV